MSITRIVIPLNDMVLFQQIKKDTTEGGLILPESAQKNHGFKVVDMGDEVKKTKKGDFIAFVPGKPIAMGNEGIDKNLFLIKEEDIIARIAMLQGEN